MKVNRHAKIVELINKYQIETQDELAEYLNEAGFKVTQATVSRDIRDLKLTKVPAENGRQKYAVLQSAQNGMTEKYVRILRDGFSSMDMAQNILVLNSMQSITAQEIADGTTYLSVMKENLKVLKEALN